MVPSAISFAGCTYCSVKQELVPASTKRSCLGRVSVGKWERVYDRDLYSECAVTHEEESLDSYPASWRLQRVERLQLIRCFLASFSPLQMHSLTFDGAVVAKAVKVCDWMCYGLDAKSCGGCAYG